MSKITQKQLIEQIRGLKEIKPRQEWVSLLKSEILNPKPETNPKFSNFEFRISNFFFGLKTKKSFAYSFATLVFVIVGLVGFAQYTMPGDLLFPVRKISEQSQAALSGQTGLKQNVATLNSRINDLAQAAKQGKKNNIPSAISEVNTQVSELAKDLKNNPVTDLETLKEIAASLKTLADVPGTDLSANSDVKDLYQTIVESQIADLEKTTLTDGQKDILTEAKELYGQGKYIDSLEKILTINK
jgi:hypothetical protein